VGAKPSSVLPHTRHPSKPGQLLAKKDAERKRTHPPGEVEAEEVTGEVAGEGFPVVRTREEVAAPVSQNISHTRSSPLYRTFSRRMASHAIRMEQPWKTSHPFWKKVFTPNTRGVTRA
jgi:hypothetical protein